jgi:hypothetical protein
MSVWIEYVIETIGRIRSSGRRYQDERAQTKRRETKERSDKRARNIRAK